MNTGIKNNASLQKEISECVRCVREGGYIIFPSEIGWSIGCDAFADEQVYDILDSDEYATPAWLLHDLLALSRYITSLPESIGELIDYSEKPMHLFPDNKIRIEGRGPGGNSAIPFRIVRDEFTSELLFRLRSPLFAAIIANTAHPEKTKMVLNKNCYMVNLRASAKANATRLVTLKFSEGGKFEFMKSES